MNVNDLSKAYDKYGSDMGRIDYAPDTNKLYLAKMRIDAGGYDAGGAYWGVGDCHIGHMYRCWNDESDIFIRAKNRDEAKKQILKKYPYATFYR